MIAAEIAEAVRKADFNFPVLPEAYLRLVSVLDNEFAKLEEIEHAISNPSILVRILQIANSAAFGRSGVYSLTGAIHRLGLNFVKNIALCVSMKSLFSCRDAILHAKLECVWNHSALMASLCSALANAKGLNPATALTCGLLHSVGELAIASYYDEHGLSSATFDEVVSLCASDVGVSCLLLWNFPHDIIDSVEPDKESPYGKLVEAAHYAEDCKLERLESIGFTTEEFRRVFSSPERLTVYTALI